MTDKRVAELTELANKEGFDLPMSAEQIMALEDAGHTVDLLTGEVIENGADARVSPMLASEKVAVKEEVMPA